MASTNIKSGSAAIAASSTVISLNGLFDSLLIWTDSGSADVAVQLQGTTAVINAADTIRIQPGMAAALRLEGLLNIDSFAYIGASASGRINWVANMDD